MSYLHYEQAGHTGKMGILRVMNNATPNPSLLGTIRWYAPRRCYVFYPMPGTLFDVVCLQDISSRVSELQAEWTSGHHEGGA